MRKNRVERFDAPASATGASIFLSCRQCPRRLGKNPGYTTSPRSAFPADGEANTDGRTVDPPARHRGPRAAACAARARRSAPQSGSPAGTRRHRGICLGAGLRRPRATTPCRSACPPNAHGLPQNFVLFYDVTFPTLYVFQNGTEAAGVSVPPPLSPGRPHEHNLNVVDCDASVTVPRLSSIPVLRVWGVPQPPEANGVLSYDQIPRGQFYDQILTMG